MKITRKYKYDVSRERNHDGITNWCWTLWIDDYAWDSFDTEAEAWAAAERYDFEQLRAETLAQTQDRERNQ